MSLLAALAAGLVTYFIAERMWPEHRWWASVGLAVLVASPPSGLLMAGGAVALWRGRPWLVRRAAERAAEADVGLMARCVLISVTAGMPLPAALELAGSQVHPLLAAEIRTLLRQARRTGLARALGESEGRGARLYLLLARAQTTGASISGAVASFVDERRQEDRSHTLEAARRLPVKLTVPLALLILPGFVTLTVGPSVLSSARRMLGPLIPLP